MTKPTILPEFAVNDVVDPDSGENNVQTPDTAAKSYGWNPALSRPFRGYMNWLHRHTYLWTKWMDEEVSGFLSGVENAKITDSHFATETGVTISWTKIADMITLNFTDDVLEPGSGGVAGDQLVITPPDINWSSAILPVTAMVEITLPFSCTQGSNTRRGQIIIPTGVTDLWTIQYPDTDGDLEDNNFTSDATNRGYPHQCISYITQEFVP